MERGYAFVMRFVSEEKNFEFNAEFKREPMKMLKGWGNNICCIDGVRVMIRVVYNSESAGVYEETC